MILNKQYYVWIDPMSGHIWDDHVDTSKKNAVAFYNDLWSKPKLKLKKIKIVEIKEPK